MCNHFSQVSLIKFIVRLIILWEGDYAFIYNPKLLNNFPTQREMWLPHQLDLLNHTPSKLCKIKRQLLTVRWIEPLHTYFGPHIQPAQFLCPYNEAPPIDDRPTDQSPITNVTYECCKSRNPMHSVRTKLHTTG